MSRSIIHSGILKSDMVLIVSVCLTFYFSFHLIFSDRSYLNLVQLENKKELILKDLEVKTAELTKIEANVRMLRPASLDRDFLEERVQVILGLGDSSDNIIMN